ncbi:hypothetical protein BCO18442_00781 [Burkholderia contaminans]|nr:hypothetical protein BCO18442_00781 [Burkholderia contaminans]
MRRRIHPRSSVPYGLRLPKRARRLFDGRCAPAYRAPRRNRTLDTRGLRDRGSAFRRRTAKSRASRPWSLIGSTHMLAQPANVRGTNVDVQFRCIRNDYRKCILARACPARTVRRQCRRRPRVAYSRYIEQCSVGHLRPGPNSIPVARGLGRVAPTGDRKTSGDCMDAAASDMPSLRPWPCRASRRRQNGHRHPNRCEVDRIRTSAPDASARVTADARRASPENRYRARRPATPVRHRDRECSEPTHVRLGTSDASLTLQLTRHRIAANSTQQCASRNNPRRINHNPCS